VKILLLILIIVISYELAKRIIERKILSKINKYCLDKNEKYYSDLLDYYDKSKMVKSSKRINIITKISILISKTKLRKCTSNKQSI
jgi:hypothetical protein